MFFAPKSRVSDDLADWIDECFEWFDERFTKVNEVILLNSHYFKTSNGAPEDVARALSAEYECLPELT